MPSGIPRAGKMLCLFKNKRATAFALSFGFLFCFFNFWDAVLEDKVYSGLPPFTSAFNYLTIFANTFFFMFLAGEGYLRLRRRLEKNEELCPAQHSRKEERRYFLFCYGVMLIAYLPVFLAYYPGLFNYDASYQISQTIGTYNRQHPLLYTLYLQFFYYIVGQKWLGSYTAGMACCLVLQTLVFSAMLAYVHLFLYKRGMNKVLRMILLGLSAVLPFFPILALSTAKDALFTGFAALFLICMFYWENEPAYYKAKRHVALYFSSVAGVILLRNNGIYAMFFALLFGCYSLVFKKKNYRFLLYTVLGIGLSMAVSSGVSAALSASPGPSREMLGVPFQQMSYVYRFRGDELSEDDKRIMKGIMPDIETFEPFVTDSLRLTGKEVNELTKEDIQCYLSLFRRYPLEYVHAFFLNNMGYFYLGDISHAEIYGKKEEERQGYLATNMIGGYDVEHVSLLPPLEKVYETLFTSNKYQSLYFLRFMCTPASYFWLLALLLFLSWDLRRNNLASFAFLGGLILTYLAAPCVLIRFALSYIVSIPVLLPAVLYKKPTAG